MIGEMHEVLLSMNKGHSFRSSKDIKDEIKMYPLRIRGGLYFSNSNHDKDRNRRALNELKE